MNWKTQIHLSIRRATLALLAFLSIGISRCESESPEFSGDRAYQYLIEQCDIGPRNPGSDGARQALDYYQSFFRSRADSVWLQRFEFTDTLEDTTFSELANVIAEFNPGHMPRIILCAHWDTRPFADLDPDSSNRNTPIPGANDGASGCAVLMEITNIVSELDSPYGIDIVLFDCEDYGRAGNHDYFCVGSKHFVENISRSKYAFGVLIDMIGDADLNIYREQYSQSNARRINDLVWENAEELGVSSFVDQIKYTIYDDHVPFLTKGIPVIDLIDFDYPYWHTIEDTPDKCSPESLADVGKVLVALLSR
jgi:hypothetical protein